MARDTRLTDPLSEVARKERKVLLGLSVLSIFIIEADAVPTKISALGIEFGLSDQQVFLWLLAAVMAYFTIAFAMYASSDYVAWRKEILHEDLDAMREYWLEAYRSPNSGSPSEETIEHERQEALKRHRLFYRLTKPISISRAFFEFLFPCVVGSLSVFIVVRQCELSTLLRHL